MRAGARTDEEKGQVIVCGITAITRRWLSVRAHRKQRLYRYRGYGRVVWLTMRTPELEGTSSERNGLGVAKPARVS